MQTQVRFSLKQLCALLLVFAIVFAVLAPIVRSWGTEWQTLFMIYGVVMLALMGATTALRCRVRYRTERVAGRRLLKTGVVPNLRTRIRQALHSAFSFGMIVGYWWLHAAMDNKQGSWHTLPPVLMWSCIAAFALPMYLTELWWGIGARVIEMCEHGFIMSGTRLRRWDSMQIKRCHWSSFKPNTLVVVERFSTWSIEVSPEHKEIVAGLFERCASGHELSRVSR